MARPNYPWQGLRLFKYKDGYGGPLTIEGHVASAYGTAIYPGDPVARQSDGSYARAAAGGGAGISGVVNRVLRYKDTAGYVRTTGCTYLPASISWTAHGERSLLEIIPVKAAQFLGCTNAALASLTVARQSEGENVDHVFGTADTGLGISPTLLDIATHATTNTLQWRLVNLLPTDNEFSIWNDPTQTNHFWVVEANVVLDVPGVPSATGV